MSEILTITLSPAIDIAADIGTLEANRKLRCTNAYTDPGGGGINVSRAIKALGGDSIAFVAVGGSTGELLLQLLDLENIEAAPFQIDGLTRQCFAVKETETGDQFRFTLPGPAWDQATWHNAIDEIEQLARDMKYIVLSGSPPPGSPTDDYERLTDRLCALKGRVILDVSGPALARTMAQDATSLFCLRLNWREAQEQAGKSFASASAAIDFASTLIARGLTKNVVITQGGDGAIAVNESEEFCFKPPYVEPESAVGAGDSFVGAMTFALQKGDNFQGAVRYGVAAAAATMMTPATRLCRNDDVQRLNQKIVQFN